MGARAAGKMLWLRELDRLATSQTERFVEVEVGSELDIPGLLAYAGDAIVFGHSTFGPDSDGLYKYVLRLRQGENEHDEDGGGHAFSSGTRNGYVARDGAMGELVALFSLRLQARFFTLSSSTRDGSHGLPWKRERELLRVRGGPHLDRIVFSDRDDRNLVHLGPFLDELRELPARFHSEVSGAAEHYARALRTIGLDQEMVYVRLVSAIEKMMADQSIAGDPLSGKRLEDLMRLSELTRDEQDELRAMFRNRRTSARFVAFLSRYSGGFFDGEKREPTHTQVTPENLPAVANAIYRARSGYLHNGDPMYISRPMREFPDWHMDPSAGMAWDDRVFGADQKLPFTDFFHRLVRHCILARIQMLRTSDIATTSGDT